MKCYNHADAEAVGTCVQCGRGLCPECMLNVNGKVTCKECTAKMAERPVVCPAPQKDPFLAVVLSVIGGIFTGGLLFSLGQLYNGHVKKFIILSLVNLFIEGSVVVLYLAGCLVTGGIGFLCCLPIFMFPIIIHIYEIYDAYISAKNIRDGVPARDWLD